MCRVSTGGNQANTRPVFVTASSIVPSTGIVSPLDARVTNIGVRSCRRLAFRPPLERCASDGNQCCRICRSASRNSWSAARIRTRRRAASHGDSTAPPLATPRCSNGRMGLLCLRIRSGSPSARLRHAAPEHVVHHVLGTCSPAFRTRRSWRATSTAMALSNDRAFVFAPSQSPTATLSSGMKCPRCSRRPAAQAHDCLERNSSARSPDATAAVVRGARR